MLVVLVLGIGVAAYAQSHPAGKRSGSKREQVEVLITGALPGGPAVEKPTLHVRLAALEIIDGDDFETKPLVEMIAARMGRIKACVERLPSTALPDGEVDVELTVSHDGAVTEVDFPRIDMSSEGARPC